jgi:hypothetical protein
MLISFPRAQAAKIDREEKDVAVRHRLCDAYCASKPADSTATAEPKDGQALDLARERQTVDEPRLQAWDGKAGNSVGDDGSDVLKFYPGGGCSLEGGFFEQGERMVLKRGGALLPPPILEIPVGWLRYVARSSAP